MVKDFPSYEIARSTKELGFISPEDRRWEQLTIPSNNHNFLKYSCQCVEKNASHFFPGKIDVILKPVCYAEGQKMIYYIGQCPRCETIYWTY